jgi:uncharacterized RDD family membrane protein YckC
MRAVGKEGTMREPVIRKMIVRFGIELIIYAVLVIAYFLVVLRLLGEPLYSLYTNNLVPYAFLALALIVVQAAALEVVTSFIMSLLGLDQLE